MSEGFKRNGMKLYGENAINFWLRIILGAIIFWIFYFPIYMNHEDLTILKQMGYIILFSLLASLTALILSYILVQWITKKQKRPRKGFYDLNGFPSVMSILYECIAVFLNALLIAIGLIIFIDSIAESWIWFCLYYLLMKIITRLIAYAMASFISRSLILTGVFYGIFFSVLFFAFTEVV